MSLGRVFQKVDEAATENERRPTVDRRYGGTSSCCVNDDRNRRRSGRFDTGTSRFRSIVRTTSVCLRAYRQNYMPIFAEFLCKLLWPWLDLPLAALRQVMYFRFYRWRHVMMFVKNGDVIVTQWRPTLTVYRTIHSADFRLAK